MLVKAFFDYVQDIRPVYVFNRYSSVHQLIVYQRSLSTSWLSITSSDRSSCGNVATSALLLLFDLSGWIGRGALSTIVTLGQWRLHQQRSVYGLLGRRPCHSAFTTALGAFINYRSSCSSDEAITCPTQPRKVISAWKKPKRRQIRLRSLTKDSEWMIMIDFHQRG